MASHTWILLCCTILSAVLGSQGLEFSISRRPGNEYCARVHCSNDVNEDVTSFCNTRLTIYDVGQAGIRTRLASISSAEPNLSIEQSRRNDVNGTGTISKYHADVTLDFRNEKDCQRGTFQCEVEFVSAKGKRDTVSETVTSQNEDSDCSCSSITDQFTRLTNRANELDRQITVIRQSNADLTNELIELRQDINSQQNDLVRIERSTTVLEENILVLQDNDKDQREEIAGLSHNNEAAFDQIARLQSKDSEHSKVIAELKRNDASQTVQIANLRQSDRIIESSLNGLNRNDTRFREDINQLKRVDETTEDAINELRRIVRGTQVDVNVLQNRDEVTADELNVLRRTNQDQDEAITILIHTDEVQRQQINNLIEADKNLQNSITQLKENDTTFDTALRRSVRTDQSIEEELAVLQRSDEDTKVAITALQENDYRTEAEIACLRSNDTSLQRQINELKEEDKVILTEISTLQDRDVAFGLEIFQLEEFSVNLDTKITYQSQNYSALKEEVRLLRQQSVKLLEYVRELNNEVYKLQQFIRSAQVTTVTRITTSLTRIETPCCKGASHTSPREKFLLYGSIPTLCDTETGDGGWIVIQRRSRGNEDFYRGWEDYKNGFGTISTDCDFWFGLENIRNITKGGFTEVRFDLKLGGKDYYAEYSLFHVDDAASNYKLTVDGYKQGSTAGDSFSYHDQMPFSTFDRDNDNDPRNCAQVKGGAWWYNCCYRSNLNGAWGKNDATGIIWKSLSEDKSLSFVEIKVRQPYVN